MVNPRECAAQDVSGFVHGGQSNRPRRSLATNRHVPPSSQGIGHVRANSSGERTIIFNLLPDSKTDEEIKEEAADEFTAILMTMKRDMDVVFSKYLNELRSLKEKIYAKHAMTDQARIDDDSEPPSFTQLLSNPNILRQIDVAMENIIKAKNVIHDIIPMPSTFDLRIPEFNVINVEARPSNVTDTELPTVHDNPAPQVQRRSLRLYNRKGKNDS